MPSLPSTVEEVERTWSFQHPKTNSHLAGEEDDWRWLHERRMVTSEEMNELRMAGIQLYVDHNVPEPQVPQPPQEWLLSSVDISLAAATVKVRTRFCHRPSRLDATDIQADASCGFSPLF